MAQQISSEDSSFGQDKTPSPDAQGQAALLLIESLIHSLLDNGTLTKSQALEAISSAAEVKEETADQVEESEDTFRKSLAILQNLGRSIEAHSGCYRDASGAGDREKQRPRC